MIKIAATLLLLLPLCSITACKGRGYVVSTAYTSVGIELTENPITQFPQIRLGLCRGFVTIIPVDTNSPIDFTGSLDVNVGILSGIQIHDNIVIGTGAHRDSVSKSVFGK